jgi:putative acetyltransferase
VLVRRARDDDRDACLGVHRAAFGGNASGGRAEQELVERLWPGADLLPELSLVAVVSGDLVGHVLCSRATLDGGPVVGLGPLGVAPEHQGHGVGTALMHAVLGAADALGEAAVFLLGDPAFYARFGFVLTSSIGVTPPDPGWQPHFQVRALHAWQPRSGAFRYCSAFDGL